MSSPISCWSISTVNQTFDYLVVNLLTFSLVVQKVSLIAISLISFGNENLHIYNRVGWPDDSWFDTFCNIFNKCWSRFVRSLQKRDFTHSI